MEPDPDPPPELDELLAHAEFVRAVARRLCRSDAHGAEDLAQDVWVAALETPDRAAPPANWLARVARNLRASRLRRASPEQGDPEIADRAPHGVDRAAVAEARLAVARAVRRLRDPYREVLVLRYYQGLAPREIALRVERPVATVHTHLKRALALLRAELARERGRERGRDGGARALVLAALPAGSGTPAPLRRLRARISLSAAALVVAGGAWIAATRALGSPARSVGVAAPAASAADREPTLRALASADARTAAAEPESAPDASAGSAASTQPAPVRYPVEVRVTDESGTPFAGAEVLFAVAQGWDVRGRSDADGRAAFELDVRELELGFGVAPTGIACLGVRAEGRASIQEVSFDARVAREEPIALLVGGAAAVLRGRVADADGFAVDGADVVVLPFHVPTGEGRGGAMLRVARHAARTDAEGRFELERLPAGEVQVHLRHPDLGLCVARAEVAAGSSAEREFLFAPGAVVHGILRAADDRPLDRARVRAYWSGPAALPNEWIRALCDPDGRYVLPLPAVGRLELWAGSGEGDLVHAALGPVDLAAGERLEWNPLLRPWDPVRVRLVDSDGAALVGWIVSLRSGPDALMSRAELTDAEGRASVSLPIEGPLRLEVMGPLNGERIAPRHVLEGVRPDAGFEHLLEIDPRLVAVGGLSGRLERAGWSPPGGLLLALQREGDGHTVRVPLDAEQRFRSASLAPGRYCLTLMAGDQIAGECARATVEPGRTLDLGVLVLLPSALLDLGAVAADAHMELACAHGAQPCWQGQGGRADPLPLLPGAYELRVGVPGAGAQPRALRFEVAPGQRIALGADLSLR